MEKADDENRLPVAGWPNKPVPGVVCGVAPNNVEVAPKAGAGVDVAKENAGVDIPNALGVAAGVAPNKDGV